MGLMEPEEKLTGGNMSAVSRAGNTVRREAGAWSAQVQRLLAHLRRKGILEVPAPLGFDDHGREVLSYIPGTVGNDPLPERLRADAFLVQAARLLRRMHDATADIAIAWMDGWQVPARAPAEVICHGDFAPYNCVYHGEALVGVIDFDHAHPGPRSWDLAYALYRFAPITAPSNPDGYGSTAEQCRRVRLFIDAYGLTERSQLVEAIQIRLVGMADMLREGAAQGDPRFQANVAAGHLAIYTTDLDYFKANIALFQAAFGA